MYQMHTINKQTNKKIKHQSATIDYLILLRQQDIAVHSKCLLKQFNLRWLLKRNNFISLLIGYTGMAEFLLLEDTPLQFLF